MANDRAYRIHVFFVPEDDAFVARVPELGVEAEADSRAEALAQIETAIEERVETAAVEGESLPPPFDAAVEPLSLELSLAPPLRRDLERHARRSGMETEALAIQLLGHALGRLDGRPEPTTAEPRERRSEEREDRPPPRRGGGRKGSRRGREGYQPDLDNQANFMEYLRGQDRKKR